MNGKILLNRAVLLLGGVIMIVHAHGQAQAPAAPQHPMTFFVTSSTPTGTGNLGGLAGADQICQNLATAVGAGNHTWHAYLSTQAKPDNGINVTEPAINARDRIGPGPWYNQKGVLIAANVADLHGDIQRDRDNIKWNTALTEKGDPIRGPGVSSRHERRSTRYADGFRLNRTRIFGPGSDRYDL